MGKAKIPKAETISTQIFGETEPKQYSVAHYQGRHGVGLQGAERQPVPQRHRRSGQVIGHCTDLPSKYALTNPILPSADYPKCHLMIF